MDHDALMIGVKQSGIDYTPIKVIPFDYEYVEGEPYPGYFKTIPVIALGSTTLIKVAQNLGWTPGVWAGDEFEYDQYIAHYGEAMLNSDAEYFAFKDVPRFEGLKFIRPVKDSKAFAGTIIDGTEFEAWQDAQIEMGVTLFPETPVLVAEPTRIDAEYRFFVVDGKVLTGSMYMYKQRLQPRELEYEYDLDMAAMAYAQSQVDRWQPAPAFVIDVAAMDMQAKTFRIIEINGFNAAGFYKADVGKVLAAVNNLF